MTNELREWIASSVMWVIFWIVFGLIGLFIVSPTSLFLLIFGI